MLWCCCVTRINLESMARGTTRVGLVTPFLVLLLLVLPAVFGQSTPDQVAGTIFTQVQCLPDSNSYVVNVRNGFVTPTTFAVQLSYDGGTTQTNSFVLQPFQISLGVAAYPDIGGVSNRRGLVSLLATNPLFNSGNAGLISRVPVICGAIQENLSSCTYLDLGCLIDNGWFWGNAFYNLLFINLPIFVLLFMIGLLYWLYSSRRTYKRLHLAPPRKSKPSEEPSERQVRRDEEEAEPPEEEGPQYQPASHLPPGMSEAEYQHTYGAGSPFQPVRHNRGHARART